MRLWGLCRKPKCPRPPVTHLPLSCSLGEAGGAGAEPPQNLPSAAAPVQTVLPLKWSGRKRGAGLSNPVPRFRRRNGNGKNPDSQGGRVEIFFAEQKNTTRPLTVWIVGTGIVFSGEMCYTYSRQKYEQWNNFRSFRFYRRYKRVFAFLDSYADRWLFLLCQSTNEKI